MKNARGTSSIASDADEDVSRPAKRPRIDPCNEERREQQDYLLPPECWAKALNFLPYDDVLSMSAVSRSMLKDAMPSIRALHITKGEQLHVGLTARYHDVVDISVYGMLQTVAIEGNAEPTLCTNEDSCGRIVPFICRFPRLERVFLGGMNTNQTSARNARGRRRPILSFIDIPFGWLAEEERDAPVGRRDAEIARGLIRSLSGAYRSGALSTKVCVFGPSCPRSEPSFFQVFLDDSCEACIDACKSFPLASVVDFESRGSSEVSTSTVDDYLICGLDVCLSRTKIQKIVADRPGGKAVLFSEERLLQLLGRGSRIVITPDEGKEMYVVKYETRAIEEIYDVVEKGGIVVSKLDPVKVVEAIKRSFALDERDPVPPMGQCHLTQSAFLDLKEFGFPITEDDFLNEMNADDDPFSPSEKKAFRFV